MKDKKQANQIFLPLNIWNKPYLEYGLDCQGKRCLFSQVAMFKRPASERNYLQRYYGSVTAAPWSQVPSLRDTG